MCNFNKVVLEFPKDNSKIIKLTNIYQCILLLSTRFHIMKLFIIIIVYKVVKLTNS